MSSKEVGRQTKVLYSSSKGKANLLEILNDNNDQYLERMAALKNFRSKSKKSTAVRTQVQDWSEEQFELIKVLDKCEKNKAMQLQNILIAGVDATSIQSLMNEDETLSSARSQLRTSYRNQIDQVKNFVFDQVKQLDKIRNPSKYKNSRSVKVPTKDDSNNNLEENESLQHQQESLIFGVCADMFLQLRSKFHNSWVALKEEENLWRREVNSFRAQLQEMLRDDKIEVQNNQLHLEILAMVRNSERLIPNSNEEINADEKDENMSVLTTNSSISSSQHLSRLPRSSPSQKQIVIPEDDPDLLNLIADITQQLQILDEESLSLSSKKQAELIALAQELDTSKPTQTQATINGNENMYETLDEIQEQTVDAQPASSRNTASISISISVHPYNNWTQSNHDIFVKIYRNAELKGLKRSKMLEQLQLALSGSQPPISSDEILVHEEWYRKTRLLQKKYKETEQHLQVQRQECISQAKYRIEHFIRDFRARVMAERELQRQEEHRQRLHEELEKLREEKRRENQERLLAMAAVEEEEKLKLEAKMRQDEEERLQKKQLVEEYQRQKALMDAEKAKQRQEEQAEAQARLQALILQNKSRVEYRAQQEARKLEQKKQREEEELQQEAKRVELLMALAAQVPYYATIQQIESRLDHVTASAKAQEYIPIGEEDRLTRGHLPLNSFNDHQIVRDARFRLTEALARAGVQHSDAARHAVAQMNPRPHLAIHGLL